MRTYIDDLEAFLEELVGFVGEMVPNSVLRRGVGLINMNAACWTA
jgi:hypothetical protein